MNGTGRRGFPFFCACAILALLGLSSHAAAQDRDLNGDGIAETLHTNLGFHPEQPVFGRVTLHSGSDGTELLAIDGPTLNDAFGFSADFVADFDGDGLADVAVTAPRAALTTDRVGRVYVYSSFDGQLLRTLFGRRGDRFGFFVGSGRDINLDGVPDIDVDGMALVGRGLPADREFVFSGVTGEMLFDQTHPIPGVQEVLVEPIETWGDLNASQSLDGGDLAVMLDLINDGAGQETGADLDADETVDLDDFDVLVQAVADGEPPVTESDYVLAEWEWDQLRASMDVWTYLYPEDVITASTNPDEWTGQFGANQWWLRGKLRSDGKRLISGWTESADDLTVISPGSTRGYPIPMMQRRHHS
ncbi:MAG: integrin alpha [Planctomycetota bacterium]|nr:integrin alpha [Planctomycetota bacterium]